METMANRIAQALDLKNGGNQSELARYVGVSPQAVQKWIAGDSEPKGKNLRKVAEFVGVAEAILKFGAATGAAAAHIAPIPQAPAQESGVEDLIEIAVLYQAATEKGRQFILKSARTAEKQDSLQWARTNKS